MFTSIRSRSAKLGALTAAVALLLGSTSIAPAFANDEVDAALPEFSHNLPEFGNDDEPAGPVDEAPEAPTEDPAPPADEAAVEEPAVEEPAVEEPAVDEPVAEEPGAEEPVAEEPAAADPSANEPAQPEQTDVNEPAVEAPVAEEPEQPAAEEPEAPSEPRDAEDGQITPVAWTNPTDGSTIKSSGVLTGTGHEGAEVRVRVGLFCCGERELPQYEPATVTNGTWEIEYWGLPHPELGLIATQVDPRTGEETSQAITVFVEDPVVTAPLIWTSPAYGATVPLTGTFEGTGTDGAVVYVFTGGNCCDGNTYKEWGRTVVVDGTWSIPYETTAAQNVELYAVQEDAETGHVIEHAAAHVLTFAAAPGETPSEEPEKPSEAPSPAPAEPAPKESAKPKPLHPTGAEFTAAGPVAGGLALLVAAVTLLTVARRRQGADL